MKRIDEMTREEILALTDGQVNVMIDYECALEGKPLLPPQPVEPPKVTDYSPDTTAYQVAGIVTTDADHAARILEAILSGTQYDTAYISGPSYEKRLTPKTSKPNIESFPVYSIEYWDSIKNKVHEAESAQEQYKAQRKEYTDAVNARADITSRIWEFISNARDEQYRRERLRNEFGRYLELAEGNRQVAMNFLKKAHEVPGDMETELLRPGVSEPVEG